METTSQEWLVDYKRLVDELLKETSDEKLVRNLMLKLGLKYSTEKMDRLSAVLEYNPHRLAQKGL